MKLSPVAAVPHKSRDYRMILDLSFALRMCRYEIPAVNEATKPLAPEEAFAMLGSALLVTRMIAAVAESKEADGPIFFSKYDIKDGFWRM